MKIFRVLKSVSIIFIIMLFSTSIVTSAEESTSTPIYKTEGTLVALGDSIATGYRLTDVQSECYVNKLAKALNKQPVNLAVNGTKSNGLLDKLKNGENTTDIKNADIITISIGGNNVLGNLLTILGSGLPAGQDLRDSSFSDLIEASNKCVEGPENEKIRKDLDEGVRSFNEDFPQIIKKVKEINPKAQITVQTVSNPVHNLIFADKFAAFVDEYLQKINEKIISESNNGDYLVADIYSLTRESNAMAISNIMSYDIHPSKYGHNIIFLANYYLLTKKYPNEINCNITNAKTNIDYNAGSIVPKVTITADDGYELPYGFAVTRGDNTKTTVFLENKQELVIPIEDCYGDITISGAAKLSKTSTVTKDGTGIVASPSSEVDMASNVLNNSINIETTDSTTTLSKNTQKGRDFKTGDTNTIIKVIVNTVTILVCIMAIYGLYIKKKKTN